MPVQAEHLAARLVVVNQQTQGLTVPGQAAEFTLCLDLERTHRVAVAVQAVDSLLFAVCHPDGVPGNRDAGGVRAGGKELLDLRIENGRRSYGSRRGRGDRRSHANWRGHCGRSRHCDSGLPADAGTAPSSAQSGRVACQAILHRTNLSEQLRARLVQACGLQQRGNHLAVRGIPAIGHLLPGWLVGHRPDRGLDGIDILLRSGHTARCGQDGGDGRGCRAVDVHGHRRGRAGIVLVEVETVGVHDVGLRV